ncbi:MAG TPA: PAS domain-containing protein [Actinomycetota bacterium]|nr:PAS domain-containing protein [Actinomycetota bacterium]
MGRYAEDLGAFSVDTEGTIFMASPRTLEMTGYDLWDLLGQPFAGYIAEDSLNAAMENFSKTLAGEQTDVLLGIRRKDGSILRVRARSAPDKDGEQIVGAVGTLEEVEPGS